MNARDGEPIPDYMGTFEQATEALRESARKWRELRQPRIASAKEHRRIELEEREARLRLAEAAALWLWHDEFARKAQP